MRRFGTQGPVYPEKHYVVSRKAELGDFIERLQDGRYIVIFAPRQTGKTTFFRWSLDKLTTHNPSYLTIRLDFQVMRDISEDVFYQRLYQMFCRELKEIFEKCEITPSSDLTLLLENTQLSDSFSMITFFQHLSRLLQNRKIVIIIDEFDGIPTNAVSDFLYALRHTYLSDEPRCPHSVGIVGVKNIVQLNYDRSISPFNVQDEFFLPNFTLEQVHELLEQYIEEVGQTFESEVIESIHKQSAGQPFLVNRLAQILTDELDIPKTKPITMDHFTQAHNKLLHERNTNIDHLITNIRRNPRFESSPHENNCF